MLRTSGLQAFFWLLLALLAFGLNRWLSMPGQPAALGEGPTRTESSELSSPKVDTSINGRDFAAIRQALEQASSGPDDPLVVDLARVGGHSDTSAIRPTATPWPTPEVIRRPMTPDELGVSLDGSGLPYEVEIHDYVISTESLGYLHAPGGVVLTMDGIGASTDPTWDAEFSPYIDFGTVEDLELSVVWSALDDGEEGWSDILGFRLDAPGSAVARWGPYEFAYFTDGGLGAIVAKSVVTKLEAEPLGEDESLMDFEATVVHMESYLLRDFDETEGVDFILFSNGWGDGSFPLTRGYDADDRLVSMFVLDERRYPWELLVSDGTPPTDVIERRRQLLECLRGERDVLVKEHYWECTGLHD